jgi:hypothetical protein
MPLVPVPETWNGILPEKPTPAVSVAAELAELREMITDHGPSGEREPARERGQPSPAGSPGVDGVFPTIDYDVVSIAAKVAKTGWLEGLAGSTPAWLTTAVTVGGFSFPPALVAGLALRWLIRRRRAKRKGVTADAGGLFLRDTTEAAQFLRLSKSEGRSPLHDALIGRLAYDELQNTIDRKPDGPEADFARDLRRRLENRFNEMAPLALEPQLV